MLLLAALATLLQLAAAVPAPAPAPEAAPSPIAELSFPEGFNETEWLAKRQGDGTGVHLVNCDGFGGEGTIIPPNSMVVFCPNDGQCNSFPSNNNRCVMSQNFLFTWEGQAQACTFPTGVRFAWFVNSNAQSQPNFAHVGDGGNQFRAYAGFKDDNHVMFNQGSSPCRSIYYFI
ncbi:hypothetical protein V8F20_001310 [Naviculisporaceae sp. PSN 640]